MSLVSLTFGYGKAPSTSTGVRMFIQKPLANIRTNPNEENAIEIVKTSQFFGQQDIYVIARVVSGVMLQNTNININGNLCMVSEIESKLGKTNAKKGMLVSFFIPGQYGSLLEKGQKVKCSIAQTQSENN